MEKKNYNIPVATEPYRVLTDEADLLNVSVNKLLPTIIFSFKQDDDIKVEVINRMLVGETITNKKNYNVPVGKEAFEVLTEQAEALNVPVKKLLPSLIYAYQQNKDIKVEVINRMLQAN